MYKALFKLIIAMISQPSRTWKMIEKRYHNDGNIEVAPKDYELFLNRYLYPFIGIITLASFFSRCAWQEFDLEIALKSSIVTFVSLFGGFYFTAYLLNEIWSGFYKKTRQLARFQLFVGFSAAVLYVLEIVRLLLHDFFFLYIFVFYTFYIVWEGVNIFLKIEDTMRMKMTVCASLLIVASPWFLSFIMSLLMPGLHN